MGARLRVFLTEKQDKDLLNLRTAKVPQKVKDRAEVIRLNAHGWYDEKIAAHFKWTSQTVRVVLHKWEKFGRESLWKEPRTYNSFQLADKLEKERSIKLSADRLRRVLKKRGSFGKELVQVIRENKTPKNEK